MRDPFAVYTPTLEERKSAEDYIRQQGYSLVSHELRYDRGDGVPKFTLIDRATKAAIVRMSFQTLSIFQSLA